MAKGYSGAQGQTIYLYPQYPDGALTGTEQANFAGLTNAAVATRRAAVVAVAVAANQLNGFIDAGGGGQSAGGANEFTPRGRTDPISLGATPGTREVVTVTAGKEFDDANDSGLADVVKLAMEDMVVGAPVAVVVSSDPAPTDGTSDVKVVYETRIGTVESVGASTVGDPTSFTFSLRETRRVIHTVAA